MRVVVDANVLVAALLSPDGTTARQMRRGGLQRFAPQLAVEEVARLEPEILSRVGITRAEWRRRFRAMARTIRVVPESRLRRFQNHPLVQAARAVDPNDAQFFAAFVAVRADVLWTRDLALVRAFPRIATRVLIEPRP